MKCQRRPRWVNLILAPYLFVLIWYEWSVWAYMKSMRTICAYVMSYLEKKKTTSDFRLYPSSAFTHGHSHTYVWFLVRIYCRCNPIPSHSLSLSELENWFHTSQNFTRVKICRHMFVYLCHFSLNTRKLQLYTSR